MGLMKSIKLTKNTEVNNQVMESADKEVIISYRDYLIKERELKKEPIKENIEKLQKMYDKELDQYNKREDVKEARKKHQENYKNDIFGTRFNITDPKIIKMYNALEALKEKLINIDSEHKIDSQLETLAHDIDNADYQNEAIEISESIIKRLEELIPVINKAADLFKMCNLTLPTSFSGLKSNVIGGINFYHNNLRLDIVCMKRLDKNELINQFNNRKAFLDEENRKKEEENTSSKIIDELVEGIKL